MADEGMRLDKFLKVSRIIKRRQVANDVCDAGRVTVNGRPAKPSVRLKVGDEVNVERAMPINSRMDGHIVQGHVDETAVCTNIENAEGSYIYTFEYPLNIEMARHGYFTVDKGSVAVNGVSLTVCNPTDNTFQVNIIPYTFEHTNFHAIKIGTKVNIEFDVLGKILARLSHFK